MLASFLEAFENKKKYVTRAVCDVQSLDRAYVVGFRARTSEERRKRNTGQFGSDPHLLSTDAPDARSYHTRHCDVWERELCS